MKINPNSGFPVGTSVPKYGHAASRNGVLRCQKALWSGPEESPSPRLPGFPPGLVVLGFFAPVMTGFIFRTAKNTSPRQDFSPASEKNILPGCWPARRARKSCHPHQKCFSKKPIMRTPISDPVGGVSPRKSRAKNPATTGRILRFLDCGKHPAGLLD